MRTIATVQPGIHWSPYLDFGFNYEELFVATMVARGFAILMTDYEGLGTIGVTHTYVNRLSEGTPCWMPPARRGYCPAPR